MTVYRRLDITRRAGVFPMESNTKTVAKRARVEPRTQVHVTMTLLFGITIPPTSRLESPIIVLDNVLKIWIELIKERNDNTIEKFYRLWTFPKLRCLVEISKIFEKMTIPPREALLLYELSEREPG